MSYSIFLIRELAIDPETIFYPDKPAQDNELESLIRRLYNCDERAIKVIKATALGEETTVEIVKFEKGVDKSLFEVPSGYTIMEY